MKAFLFPNEEALRLALSGALLSEDLTGAEAGLSRGPDGALRVHTASKVGRGDLARLKELGAQPADADAEPERQASCWAELVAPRPAREDLDDRLVLFLVPGDEPGLELSAEMLRLGCDRQDFCAVPGVGTLVRAQRPPYFTLASLADGTRRARAFVPDPAGQDGVFCEVGSTHPLAKTLRPPAGRLLLVGADARWLVLPAGPWTSLYSVLDVTLPDREEHQAEPVLGRLQVPLRLSRATRHEQATLWVLREGAVEAMDALVGSLSDEVLARLTFAATGGPGEPLVVLRARPGRTGPPQLVLPPGALPCVNLMQIPNLFVPLDASVEPPLRREKLRELLAPGSDALAWLSPKGDGGFEVESLPESAFQPLPDWVDYVIHARADALAPWVKSAVFEFEPFTRARDPELEGPRRRRDHDDEPRPRREREAPQAAAEPVEEAPRAAAPKPAPRKTTAPSRAAPLVNDLEKELLTAQQRFLDLQGPPDAPERGELWLTLGDLHGGLRQGREAGLCWTRALWELDGEAAAQRTRHWAEGEARLAGTEDVASALARGLAATAPTVDETRAVVATLALAATGAPEAAALRADLPRIQAWLDRQDDSLDVRSLWLGRASLARLVGGDRLGLARARDRVLSRLRTGLSLERDVPSFLRALGRSGAEGHRRLAQALGEVREKVEKTRRKTSAIEARFELTRAYAHLILATGYARLGIAEEARGLRDLGLKALDTQNPVHGFLTRAYAARVDQALEGLPPETPLPPAVRASLDGLGQFQRFKVDRLRQASPLLEPQERLDPIMAFSRGEVDPRGAEFAGLRGVTDPAVLEERFAPLLSHALEPATPAAEAVRLLDGLMDFLPAMPESQALPKLQAMIPAFPRFDPEPRARLLEEALLLAGYFGRSDLVGDVVRALDALFDTMGPDDAVAVGSAVGRGLRALRRVGLRHEASRLLERAASKLTGVGPAVVRARLSVAGALCDLGHLDQAEPMFADARKAIASYRKPEDASERLATIRALASALGQAPRETAVTGILGLFEYFPEITDSFSTNDFFCLSVLHFVESVVQGLASEDLALGEFGRRWLDEEEYLVRRRVHRELAELGA